ncbi:unnamed protein product [Cuscuta epithymum]|uniref:Uncharacterized protein n=1 Tax=Cuscuta epithymum TaxID=186058 RepID=A0AAV0G6V3_9ASTE|nr:unnamed protein product [Cuscuta epithymum]
MLIKENTNVDATKHTLGQTGCKSWGRSVVDYLLFMVIDIVIYRKASLAYGSLSTMLGDQSIFFENRLFILMTQHGIEYEKFYEKLYALLDLSFCCEASGKVLSGYRKFPVISYLLFVVCDVKC